MQRSSGQMRVTRDMMKQVEQLVSEPSASQEQTCSPTEFATREAEAQRAYHSSRRFRRAKARAKKNKTQPPPPTAAALRLRFQRRLVAETLAMKQEQDPTFTAESTMSHKEFQELKSKAYDRLVARGVQVHL